MKILGDCFIIRTQDNIGGYWSTICLGDLGYS